MKPVLLICDAGPLILLAKLDQLCLLREHARFDPVVLQCVEEEVMKGPFVPGEIDRLRAFFHYVPPVPHERLDVEKGGLSASDRSSLAWLVAEPAAWLLADDRLLRKAAIALHRNVIGFPGLLLDSVHSGVLEQANAVALLDQAVSLHGYRISVALYQRIRALLQADPD